MVVGGLILTVFLAPPALYALWVNTVGVEVGAVTKPGSAWKEIGIWTGAPILVSSGLVAFLAQWRTIVRAIEGLIPSEKRKAKNTAESAAADAADPARVRPEEVEVPFKWFVGGMLVAGSGVVIVAWRAFEIPLRSACSRWR